MDDVDDATVRGMVAGLRPGWTVETVERATEGTDLVAFLDVATPEGRREVVLKATTAGFVPPEAARAEPRLLALVGRETSIPVPEVYDYRDAHPDYPAPFYLLERLPGENFEDDPWALPADARRRIAAAAGRNLAELHDLGPLPAAGHLGVRDGDLTVLDTDERPRYCDCREQLLDAAEDTLDALPEGGFFPELADEPGRFADLVPDLRAHVRATVPDLPDPDPPTYCHWDYRYGNLLVDPETGETNAVLDWAHLMATAPAHNLAKVEAHLLPREGGVHPENDAPGAALQRVFRDAYAATRDGWQFDADVREWMRSSRLLARLDAMACLPLWHEDATPAERDEVAASHREFVRSYL